MSALPPSWAKAACLFVSGLLIGAQPSADEYEALSIVLSCRLYFDARGESDLRLPLDSSLAVIRLNDSLAAAAAQACQCRTPAAAAAGGAGAAPAGCPACSGSFDLDAVGTRLLVHAPNACHTFVQKPGHYKVSTKPTGHCNSTGFVCFRLVLLAATDHSALAAVDTQHSDAAAAKTSI